jgi:hypothetical protein
MNYTPEEIAELLKERPNQLHYIAGLVRRAVEAEREACAKLCEEMARRHDDIRRAALEVVAEWIRARKEP